MIDKKTFLAFLLIAGVMIVWSLLAPQPPQQPAQQERAVEVETIPVETETVTQAYQADAPAELLAVDRGDVNELYFNIETPYYTATISNLAGGSIVSFFLKNYFKHDSSSVNLIGKYNTQNLQISGVSTESGPFILNQAWTVEGILDGEDVFVESGPVTVRMMTLLDGLPVTKSLTFYSDSYIVESQLDLTGAAKNISLNSILYSWNGGLPGTEKNTKDDATYFKGYLYQGGEVIKPDIDDYEDGVGQVSYNGNTDWVAVRTKYFISALIPSEPALGAIASGKETDKKEYHNVGLVLKADTPRNVSLFLGPLEYKKIKGLGVDLQKTMSLGFAPIRPISRGVLFLMQKLYTFIPNYGVVLIVFSILVKLAVFPLTKKSYESTRKMQEVQPLIADLKAKHKNDPQKLNKATMALYKEYGVNPLGGCLPVVLQMPLLFALFQVFRSTIELRGAPFVLWIRDLSAPDTLIEVSGFPLNILPLVMVVTMLLQQKMTPAQGGAQGKTTMYVMNVFFLFLFYNFPSGLNLYYTLFNGLTILQQKFLTPHKPLQIPVKTKKKK